MYKLYKVFNNVPNRLCMNEYEIEMFNVNINSECEFEKNLSLWLVENGANDKEKVIIIV